MENGHVRVCPGCTAENPPSALRCSCGVLLTGVDVTLRQAAEPDTPTASPTLLCPFEDCAQQNPAGSTDCVYCGRPLSLQAPAETLQSLLSLPSTLAQHYRIQQPLPTRGAEAELLLVEPLNGGAICVAKIYRHGILPNREVVQRIQQIDLAHRVNILDEGVADGHAYELMEYCSFGSLRQQMSPGPFPSSALTALISELAQALQAVHAVGLVHRDIKPENILLRQRFPLDVVLTDFAVASVMDVTQRFTGEARTLPYAAPETISGVIDYKADYWAMGMIILECILARHPFAGLSEAVILHHLTTRALDLAAVTDAQLRKLLTGLLQRDPSNRWGAEEITRWLKQDPNLVAPWDNGGPASFAAPYKIQDKTCYNAEQLGAALAQHWQEGLSDLMHGQLLAWFRDEQKDQNVVRLLMQLREQKEMPLELQLHKLIQHLAPGLPPTWKGESLTLQSILRQASLALKHDKHAARWLDNLHYFDVLSLYPHIAPLAELNQRWRQGLTRYQQQLQQLSPLVEQHQDYDPMRPIDYAGFSFHAESPALEVHGNLLAILYDHDWANKLRAYLHKELAQLTCQASWVTQLGDVSQMDVATLLVLDKILPQLRQNVTNWQRQQIRNQVQQEEQFNSRKFDLDMALNELRQLSDTVFITIEDCSAFHMQIEQCQNLLLELQKIPAPNQNAAESKQELLRQRNQLDRLQRLVNQLEQQRTLSSSWLSNEVLRIAIPILILAMLFWSHLILLPLIALFFWRFHPDYVLMKQVKRFWR